MIRVLAQDGATWIKKTVYTIRRLEILHSPFFELFKSPNVLIFIDL